MSNDPIPSTETNWVPKQVADDEINGWKARAEQLQADLDLHQKNATETANALLVAREKGAALSSASADLINRLQEVTTHVDWRTHMAVAEIRLGRYTGPWIIDEIKKLVATTQDYQATLPEPDKPSLSKINAQ